jgi:hypothetical protein
MTKTIENINIHTWFIDRELTHVPKHFVYARTALTPVSRAWILERTTGRFALTTNRSADMLDIYPAFEDPREAVFYELSWG